MEITVNLEKLDLTTVIDQVAEIDPDGEERYTSQRTLGEVVADRVFQHIIRNETRDSYYSGLAQRIREIRDELIRERVGALITEALTAPIVQTNGWGEKRGEPTTLRELIASQATQALKTPASNSSYERERTLRDFVNAEVNSVLKKELAAAVAEEKARVVAAVQGKAAELIAEAVKAGVRS